jgi:homoserine acetyltransferase
VRRFTGNSQVIGEAGWWNDIVGVDKTIDVRKYTIVSLMCQVMVSIQLLSKIIEIL